VTEVKENGVEVKIAGTDIQAFIRRADLARDRSDQRTERFAVGERLDARVTQFDQESPQDCGLSIKALEMAEEKEAVAQYGSSDCRCIAWRYPGCGAEPGPGRRRRLVSAASLSDSETTIRRPVSGYETGRFHFAALCVWLYT
jgi:hypothetical protein